MQFMRGGARRPTRQPKARTWALAIGVAALAFPATALGAENASAQHEAGTSQAQTGAPRQIAPALPDLEIGAGYGSPGGSSAVRALQRRLTRAGYPPGRVDGLFGLRTRQAAIAYQAAHGLRVDGVVGPQTWAALAAGVTILEPGAADQPGRPNAVRSLQRHLASVGDPPGPVDGRYGILTERAVRRFQSAHQLRVDGIAGPRTLARLDAASRRHEPSRVGPRSFPGAPALSPKTVGPRPNPAVRPVRTPPRGSGRPSGSGGLPWMAILGVLTLAVALLLAAPLIVAALRYPFRRGDEPSSSASTTRRDTDRTVSRHEPAAAAGNDRELVAGSNGTASRANGHPAQNGAPPGNEASGTLPFQAPAPDVDESDEAGTDFERGLLLEGQGNLAGAQAAYRRAEARGHGAAASHLGQLLEEQGAVAEAEAAYRRADDRGDAAGAFNLGVLLHERRDVAQAAEAYRRAIDRGNAAAASNLGVLLEEQGELAAAEAAFREADQRGDATAAFNLGVLLEERGAVTGAEEAYRRAERRDDGEVANMARAALHDLGGTAMAHGVKAAGQAHDA